VKRIFSLHLYPHAKKFVFGLWTIHSARGRKCPEDLNKYALQLQPFKLEATRCVLGLATNFKDFNLQALQEEAGKGGRESKSFISH